MLYIGFYKPCEGGALWIPILEKRKQAQRSWAMHVSQQKMGVVEELAASLEAPGHGWW